MYVDPRHIGRPQRLSSERCKGKAETQKVKLSTRRTCRARPPEPTTAQFSGSEKPSGPARREQSAYTGGNRWWVWMGGSRARKKDRPTTAPRSAHLTTMERSTRLKRSENLLQGLKPQALPRASRALRSATEMHLRYPTCAAVRRARNARTVCRIKATHPAGSPGVLLASAS